MERLRQTPGACVSSKMRSLCGYIGEERIIATSSRNLRIGAQSRISICESGVPKQIVAAMPMLEKKLHLQAEVKRTVSRSRAPQPRQGRVSFAGTGKFMEPSRYTGSNGSEQVFRIGDLLTCRSRKAVNRTKENAKYRAGNTPQPMLSRPIKHRLTFANTLAERNTSPGAFRS